MALLGIIGGSGLYDMPGLTDIDEIHPVTPFGRPSSPITLGTLGPTRLAFIARHGRGHIHSPSEVPYRANIFALRSLGATHVLSISAVGSLRQELPPKTAVVPDQIIDRTVGRRRTFFDGGVVAHVGLADPFCSTFRDQVYRHTAAVTDSAADGGTYLCIEGPQFSTRAESQLYRSWNCDVIGMTAMPEARLAREAELCYAMVAMVTDYDVWHATEDDVSVESVQRVLASNVETGRNIVRGLAETGLPACESECGNALLGAVITNSDALTSEAATRLALFRS